MIFLASGLITFFYIFLKASQQINVVRGRYLWVMPTSIGMGLCEVSMVLLVVRADTLWLGIATGIAGGTGANVGNEITQDGESMSETKPTNPKDIVAQGKLSLGLMPDSLKVYAAMAFTEGAIKYGRYNWRIAGVSASVYHDALDRHLSDWWNGEDFDPVTKVHNLASVIACAGIILDAELCGKLTDDRPPSAPVSGLIDGSAGTVAHLKELFKDHNPKQYTIEDSEK